MSSVSGVTDKELSPCFPRWVFICVVTRSNWSVCCISEKVSNRHNEHRHFWHLSLRDCWPCTSAFVSQSQWLTQGRQSVNRRHSRLMSYTVFFLTKGTKLFLVEEFQLTLHMTPNLRTFEVVSVKNLLRKADCSPNSPNNYSA